MEKQFISWRRVSTAKQRGSHLGLEAQKSIIDFFIEREKGELIADYEECHSGTDIAGCTELKKAKAHCKRTGATLIIAKTDRCRDTIEALQLYEEMNGRIYFCDLPHTDKFTLTLFFSLAEREAMIVSLRTKQALAALKARGGVKLGAASCKYKETRSKTNKEELKKTFMERGELKSKRYLESRDQQAFIKVLRNVFPEYTESSNMKQWVWQSINTRMIFCEKMLKMMKDYQELDAEGKLFCKWDFEDESACVVKLRSYLQAFRKSVLK